MRENMAKSYGNVAYELNSRPFLKFLKAVEVDV